MHNSLTFGQQTSMTSTVATELEPKSQISPEMQAQEQAWALAVQKGDQTAFMNIVDTFQRPVYNLCYRMLGDSAEAEDAAQETFLRAYTKINTYSPARKFSSWLLSIASHYCIDRLRKRRYHTVSWDDLPPWRWVPDTAPQPEEAALSHERHDNVRALLDTLPADYRAATILRYWYELPYEEIAETLDTSVSAVKSRLFRARQMLAKAAEQSEAQLTKIH